MSNIVSNQKCADVESKAILAERKIGSSIGGRAQIEATIDAAELYLQALRLVDNPADKKRLDDKTRHLLAHAETLKLANHDRVVDNQRSAPAGLVYPCSTRQVTTREKIILLEGSKLNGAVFKPWDKAPAQEEFILRDGEDLFCDDFVYSLSVTQAKHFAEWKRPKDALANISIGNVGQPLPNEVTMTKYCVWDMVQDVAPDCSVVASFCVGAARAERGHERLFGRIVWPYDHELDCPLESQNGKYILRFYFNGCWRRVEIDDRLPTSKTTRALHVVNRPQPGLIWPTIAEKAYLKVRGGYDFPGSNSGTDLAVLTGWIPQQIFLHDEDVETARLWAELMPAFTNGEIMCTLGTGRLSRREQQMLGLGAEHDYAVLDMKASGDDGELLIKNPWADGDVWKGATRCRPNPGHEGSVPTSPLSPVEMEDMKPGTFWMNFNRVFQYFEHMYLNWNPGLFKYRQDLHFTWNLADTVSVNSLLIDNPQYTVRTTRSGEAWILLNRHFRTGDYSVQNQGKNGYIGLYLFDSSGYKVFSTEDSIKRGPFVDSPNTLLRFQAQAHKIYTLVAVSQDVPAGKHNFTISAFANSSVELIEASNVFHDSRFLTASWTRLSAGGSSNSSTYLQNPQFTLTLPTETKVAFILESLPDGSATSLNSEIHVKILVASSDGKRITKLRQRDFVAQSGDYKRGSAVIETVLPTGAYTIICSTFEPNQLCKFRLGFYSTIAAPHVTHTSFKLLPSEGSGRFIIPTTPAVFSEGITKVVAPIIVPRLTKALFKASSLQGSGSALFKMSIDQGKGPYRHCITSSASENLEYSPIANGLRIEDIDLRTNTNSSTETGGLWLVLEKPEQSSTETQDMTSLRVDVLSEEKIEIGPWTPHEGF